MSFSEILISVVYAAGVILAVIYMVWLVDTLLSRRLMHKGATGVHHAVVAVIVAILLIGGISSAKLLPVSVQAQVVNIALLPDAYRGWIKNGLAAREPAVLLQHCRGGHAQLTLAEVLSRQGEPAVKPLLAALQSENPAARSCARLAFTSPRMQPQVLPLLPELAEALHTPSARADVLAIIASLGEQAKPAVPALITLLDDDTTRLKSAEVLGGIGRGATPAASKLIDLFTAAKQEEERITYAVAITLISPRDAAARPAIQYALLKRGFKREVNARGNRWLREMQ